MKKTLFLFLAMALILLPLAVYGAGGRQQPAASGPKPEVSFTMLDRGNIAASEGTYAQNRWVDWTNEKSPVRIRPVPVIRSQVEQQINALFASGMAPDLIINYGRPFLDVAYYQGVIQPVDQHIAQFSTTYKAYLQKYPELLPYLTADDGKQYALSTRRGIEDLYNFCWWIRQDWLQKFNMPVPANTDQLINFMRRVKSENPSGIAGGGYGFVFRFLYNYEMQNIFGRPYKNFGVENGHFVDWTSTPGYRDWLAFMALMFREGLMYPEFVTDTSSTQMEMLRETGRAGVYFGVRPSNGDGFFGKTLRRNIPGGVLVPFDPPATSYGKFSYGASPDGVPEYYVVMNKALRNAQPAIQYMDWLMDNWMTLTYGFEGTHYNLNNGVPVTIDPTNSTGIRDQVGYLGDWAFLKRRHEIQTPAFLYTQTVVPADPLSVEYGTIFRDWFAARANDKPVQYVPYLPASDAINRYESEVVGQGTAMTQVRQLEMGIIIGQVPLDAGIQMINQYKNANGWAQVNAEKDAWYQANKNLFRF
jgi:putative aldouronate transport system substrate-binding protein